MLLDKLGAQLITYIILNFDNSLLPQMTSYYIIELPDRPENNWVLQRKYNNRASCV